MYQFLKPLNFTGVKWLSVISAAEQIMMLVIFGERVGNSMRDIGNMLETILYFKIMYLSLRFIIIITVLFSAACYKSEIKYVFKKNCWNQK